MRRIEGSVFMGVVMETEIPRARRRKVASIEDGFVNVARGSWGENEAVKFLLSRGWRIVGRNVRPCRRDQRCEIDIVATPRDAGRVVFVEVKTHARRREELGRLQGMDARKRRNMLRACANWVMSNRWHGDFRFDVVEVYGSPNNIIAIDHIENVPLFPPKWRFW